MTNELPVPDNLSELLGKLVIGDEPVAEGDMPPRLENPDEVTVTSSIELSFVVHKKVEAAAEERGVSMSQLIREWVEDHFAES